MTVNNLADAISYYESMSAGRVVWDEGIAFARARGLVYAEMWCRGERLLALYHGGSWDELEREADLVSRWVEEHGGGQLEVFAHVYQANVQVHRGSLASAAGHVTALLPRARESGDPQVLFRVLRPLRWSPLPKGTGAGRTSTSPSSSGSPGRGR